MSITAHWYTLALSEQYSGSPVNWTSDPLKCGLVTASYTPSQDTDQYWSGPQANETSGAGYTAGGVSLTSTTVGGVTGSHEIPLLAANVSWSSASFSCRYAIIYKNTGSAATSPLLGWVDFGATETVSSGTFTINWDSVNGVLALQAS